MQTYTIFHKTSGAEMARVQADSAEAALIAMERDHGAMAVEVLDDQRGVSGIAAPEVREFASYTEALAVFVPEALADFETAH